MMGALIRALTNNAVENIEEALGMTDATSSAMKHASAEWYATWYGRVPTKTEGCLAQLVHNGIRQTLAGIFGFGRDAAIPCGIPLCDGVLHSLSLIHI